MRSVTHWAFWSLISDGKKLPLDRRHKVFHNGTLEISKVSRKDAGDYACSASNRQGTVATQKGTVKVIGEGCARLRNVMLVLRHFWKYIVTVIISQSEGTRSRQNVYVNGTHGKDLLTP